ncbi:uncharacterized protein [Venturia canescens]|uniref:uncharacterized protein n=1 Tax=Venturia canescens TaxID=32260 RepID=UPI001C9CE005|nr:uncharacterized protein LOC122413571 [Venturia canescens]
MADTDPKLLLQKWGMDASAIQRFQGTFFLHRQSSSRINAIFRNVFFFFSNVKSMEIRCAYYLRTKDNLRACTSLNEHCSLRVFHPSSSEGLSSILSIIRVGTEQRKECAPLTSYDDLAQSSSMENSSTGNPSIIMLSIQRVAKRYSKGEKNIMIQMCSRSFHPRLVSGKWEEVGY